VNVPSSPAGARTAAPERVVRHRLTDRFYHWIMAVSVLTLSVTAFLPIVGIKFDWVTIHWIAGVVLSAAVVFHIVRALAAQDWRAMAVGPKALAEGVAELEALAAGAPPPRAAKYPIAQRLYHLAIAVLVLITMASGGLMLAKIDTPLWRRDPYFLADQDWGWVYLAHGYAAMAILSLILVHIYFGLRPDKWWITRSMIRGWITRREYLDHHDPARWSPER